MNKKKLLIIGSISAVAVIGFILFKKFKPKKTTVLPVEDEGKISTKLTELTKEKRDAKELILERDKFKLLQDRIKEKQLYAVKLEDNLLGNVNRTATKEESKIFFDKKRAECSEKGGRFFLGRCL